jgi:hypothetical protein
MSLQVKKYNGLESGKVSSGCGNMVLLSSAFFGVLAFIVADIVYKPGGIAVNIAAATAAAVVAFLFISNTKIIEPYEDFLMPDHLFDESKCVRDEGGYCHYDQQVKGDKKWGGYSDIDTY